MLNVWNVNQDLALIYIGGKYSVHPGIGWNMLGEFDPASPPSTPVESCSLLVQNESRKMETGTSPDPTHAVYNTTWQTKHGWTWIWMDMKGIDGMGTSTFEHQHGWVGHCDDHGTSWVCLLPWHQPVLETPFLLAKWSTCFLLQKHKFNCNI